MTLAAITVIIVTYNSESTIERCLTLLAAALAQLPAPAEVIVWDNDSHDATLARIGDHPLSRQEQFLLVASKENLGFGGANNAAATHATAPTLLLLNPDAFLDDPASIVVLLKTMRAGNAAMVGPFLANADGSHQVGDAGHAETLGVAALWALGLNMLPGIPGSFLSRTYAADTPAFAIDWICGACLMIARDVYDRLGGFDVRIFLYSEDVDLGIRAKALGLKTLYVPAVRVRHIQGVSLAGDRISTTWLESRFALFDRANRPHIACYLFAIILTYGFGWRWAAHSVAERLSARRRQARMASKLWTYLRYSAARIRRLGTNKLMPGKTN